MSNHKTTEQAEQPVCGWISAAFEAELAWMLASPVLSRELLDHAMFCADCSARIQAIEDAEFESISPEERAECDLLADQFIKKNFPDSFPVCLSSIHAAQPLRMAAQQEIQSDWPLRLAVEVQVKENQLSATLEFDSRGPCIVVQQIGALGSLKLVLRHTAQTREIELTDSRKAVLGTLDEFDLTDQSPKEEIETQLKAMISIHCRQE